MPGPQADDLPLPPIPDEKFGVLSFDPPWHYATFGKVKDDDTLRTPQKHYPTMSLKKIGEIPVREMALPDAWVFLWITGPLMAQGVHRYLFDKWGVKPSSTAFTWFKLNPTFETSLLDTTPLLERDLFLGMGHTTRQNCEFVMLGKIGKPKVARKDIRQVIVTPVREHSRKPDEYYRRVEHFAHGPRLDAFPGQDREGWTSWGIPHRDDDRVDQQQRTGRRARCHTCEQPAQVNDVGVCAPCMQKAALPCPTA